MRLQEDRLGRIKRNVEDLILGQDPFGTRNELLDIRSSDGGGGNHVPERTKPGSVLINGNFITVTKPIPALGRQISDGRIIGLPTTG